MKPGWHGRVIDTLRNLYDKTHFWVKHNGKISPILPDILGVKQGGNASGLLFRKYLADLCDYLKQTIRGSQKVLCIKPDASKWI